MATLGIVDLDGCHSGSSMLEVDTLVQIGAIMSNIYKPHHCFISMERWIPVKAVQRLCEAYTPEGYIEQWLEKTSPYYGTLFAFVADPVAFCSTTGLCFPWCHNDHYKTKVSDASSGGWWYSRQSLKEGIRGTACRRRRQIHRLQRVCGKRMMKSKRMARR